jgi:hypothetical protein
MIHSVSTRTKPKVYKQRQFGACPTCHPEAFVARNPWMVCIPYGPPAACATWREALDLALKYRPPVLMN